MSEALHPARFSKNILYILRGIIDDEFKRVPRTADKPFIRILDPFAGTGRIHELQRMHEIYTWGIEIEPEWADLHERTFVGDATALPWEVASFNVVVTSPTYGNRLCDHHNPQDASVRRSYTFDLRNLTGDPTRQLATNNTGLYAFPSRQYKELHVKAWHEVWRVLEPGGLFVLNLSDFVKRKQVVNVCRWHIDTLMDMGFAVERELEVATPRLRFGTNAQARVAHEKIYCLRRP